MLPVSASLGFLCSLARSATYETQYWFGSCEEEADSVQCSFVGCFYFASPLVLHVGGADEVRSCICR